MVVSSNISPQRRREIIDALRRGTVPRRSLDAFAVGLDRFVEAIDHELSIIESGGSVFKAIRGDYGSGKTFFSRWFQERARSAGYVSAEVQISETETPLHRLETVYRRLIERLSTSDTLEGAFRSIVDGWFYALEEDVLSSGEISENDSETLVKAVDSLLEKRLASISDTAPAFSAALRGYRKALLAGDSATAQGLLGWLGATPNVSASIKRTAGIKGDVDHFGALAFLQGLLLMLRDSGFKGLVLVLDEVETLQRVRTDVRDKGLNALRQLIDEIDSGRFPGLYLVVTGTPAFFDGTQGIKRLPPLAQRLDVDFSTDVRFDNPRAVQIRLQGFNIERLVEVACKIRGVYCQSSENASRIEEKANNDYVTELASAVTGKLGGKVGIAPRIFLKKLVSDVLDRIDQFDDFNPREHYQLTMADSDLRQEERAAMGAEDLDDIELDL